MRQANQAVLRERYPIPTVEEVLQNFNNSIVFSKLDIKLACHQIVLDSESRQITTFMTHKGVHRYKRLIFGTCCAPEMYNKIIQQTLDRCNGVQSIFDDIVMHGKTTAEHDQRLDIVLRRLSDRGLTLNIDKYQFNMTHIEFMGHVLSKHGISMVKSKVEAIKEARQPETISEVRSFLGLVNFSSTFIPNLATKAEPLRKLARMNVPFKWGPEQATSFQELKDQISQASTLGYFDPSAQTIVITDASPVGLGAVLVQQQRSDYGVIMYASRTVTDVERRYSQTEKEALGLIWGCERFHMYLNIADSLSRLVLKFVKSQNDNDDTEEYIRSVTVAATPIAVTTREIERTSENDDELSDVRRCILSGHWERCQFKEYLPVRNELCAIGQIILRGTRIVIPKNMRARILELGHEGHPGIIVMKRNKSMVARNG